MIEVTCDLPGCEETKERYRSVLELADKNFCSVEHQNLWQSIFRSGENAPNYGKTFSKEHRQNISDAMKVEKIEVECSWCGKTKEVIPSHYEKHDKFFCGGDTDCFGNWMSENGISKVTVECDLRGCEQTKEVYPSRLERRNHHFCCSDHRQEWWSQSFSGENHPNYKKEVVECGLEECNETKKVHPCRLKTQDNHFCCDEHHYEWRSRTFSGENAINYIDGRSSGNYPSEFLRKRKNIIRRDGEECKMCGMTREEHKEQYGRDIEVHHIDGNRKNNDDSNLVTLCKKCNVGIEYMSIRPQFEVSSCEG